MYSVSARKQSACGKFLWARISALQPEPCPVPWSLQICLPASSRVEQRAWHRHCCPAHHRDGEMETGTQSDSQLWMSWWWSWGRHWEQIHSPAQNVKGCSGTAGAHTAPLPSTKKRKWLLQEQKKYPLNKENKERGKNSCAQAPGKRKDLFKLGYWHLSPTVHNDYCWPLSWACSFNLDVRIPPNLREATARMGLVRPHSATSWKLEGTLGHLSVVLVAQRSLAAFIQLPEFPFTGALPCWADTLQIYI